MIWESGQKYFYKKTPREARVSASCPTSGNAETSRSQKKPRRQMQCGHPCGRTRTEPEYPIPEEDGSRCETQTSERPRSERLPTCWPCHGLVNCCAGACLKQRSVVAPFIAVKSKERPTIVRMIFKGFLLEEGAKRAPLIVKKKKSSHLSKSYFDHLFKPLRPWDLCAQRYDAARRHCGSCRQLLPMTCQEGSGRRPKENQDEAVYKVQHSRGL